MAIDPDLVAPLKAITDRLAALERSTAQHDSALVTLADGQAAFVARLDKLEAAPAPAVPAPSAPVDVSSWIGINIQTHPYERNAADKRAGYDRVNLEHRLSDKAHAEAPCSFARPQTTGQEVMRILDPRNLGETRPWGLVLRDPINSWQLTPDGVLTGPGRQAFVDEWVSAGGRLMAVNMWQGNEAPTDPVIAQGPAAVRAHLEGVGAQAAETLRRYVRWIKRQSPDVQAAVVGLETMNEPAIYLHAVNGKLGNLGLSRAQILDLFCQHNLDAAKAAQDEGWDGPVLMPLFGYNGRADELIESIGGQPSVLSRWRAALGDRLVLSRHAYPDWIRASDVDTWKARLLADIARTDPVPTVITETNAGDLDPAHVTAPSYHATRVLGELTAAGIPIMWFSTMNFGPGALLAMNPKPPLTRNIDRIAALWDALAAVRPGPSHTTEPFRVLRSPTDPRGGYEDRLRRIVAPTEGGVIAPTGPGATLIYGGAGSDHITINPDGPTWVYGGPGADHIDASRGPWAAVILGDGADTVRLGADVLIVSGRGGGDRFVLSDTGSALIDNFEPGVDRIDTAGMSVTATTDGPDLVLSTPGGGIARFLRRASSRKAMGF